MATASKPRSTNGKSNLPCLGVGALGFERQLSASCQVGKYEVSPVSLNYIADSRAAYLMRSKNSSDTIFWTL